MKHVAALIALLLFATSANAQVHLPQTGTLNSGQPIFGVLENIQYWAYKSRIAEGN